MKPYYAEYDKAVRRWSVYEKSPFGDEWICDCVDKATANLIADALNSKFQVSK